ncbi:MAG TPA: glycerol kinase [Chthonomonadaceae bacterium]|nr:glycerol kinase [Chthonomonadaceae bacterium]
MAQYILALDQGTTSSRAMLFDAAGRVCGREQKEYTQLYPQPGWVEHDPEDIWYSQLGVAVKVLQAQDMDAAEIAAIGLTNQRETTLLWERATGRPVANAIVWQDRRTAPLCEELRERGYAPLFQARTGLTLDPYFSATKIRWLLDNVPELRGRAERGEIAFGTVDTFLLWRLTGGQVHATDVSNASRTLLYNIVTQAWDEELLELLDIPHALLPEVLPSSHVYGKTIPTLLGAEIPIAGIAGDQQAATFGQACVQPGMVKNTYGTGSFLLMNTGAQPQFSRNGLLTTTAWQLGEKAISPPARAQSVGAHWAQQAAPLHAAPNAPLPEASSTTPSASSIVYALEGSVFVTGAAVQWLRDELQIIRNAGEIEALAASVPDNGGVYFVPAFVGLGAPYWDAQARGAIVGLTRGAGRAHLARAALEAACFQRLDVLEAMRADCGLEIPELRVDGGMTVNNFLLQMQADILGTAVVRPAITETTALGAAYLAGLAVGYWRDVAEIAAQWKRDATFEPNISADRRATLVEGWRNAVARIR